jgi:4-amino-4-deoxy-L-arabinose transferase-like glycosyltransferase
VRPTAPWPEIAESTLEARVSRALAWLAALFFCLVALWESTGPILAGHYAATAGMGVIADNYLHWDVAGPVWEYTLTRPREAAFYCHHPFATFRLTELSLWLLGRTDFAARAPAIALSAVTPLLLHGIGRRLYRPAAGAAAALAFVVLPITLSFAAMNALEVPVTAWSLLGLYGLVRFTDGQRARDALVSLAGFGLAMHSDWAGFLVVGGVLAVVGLSAFVLPERLVAFGGRGRMRPRAVGAYWAALASLAVLSFAYYVALFHSFGKLDDLLAAYGQRSAGRELPLGEVLASRRYWIELSFSPVAIALGKLAALVVPVRLALTRRAREALPLAVLFMATVQYVVFRQGADIHVFWPHYFGAFFALGMGALVDGACRLASRVSLLLRGAPLAHAWALALGLAAAPLALVLRDGLPALLYARETGGRFNEKGLLIHSDGAKLAFLRAIAPRLEGARGVDLHEGMKGNWAHVWALGKPGARVVGLHRPVPVTPAREPYLADTRFLLDELQEGLVSRFHVTAHGPFFFVDRERQAPLDALRLVTREPSLFERFFVSGTEPVRSFEPDALTTWELRHHLAPSTVDAALLDAARATSPRDVRDRRMLANLARATGDPSLEAREAELLAAYEPIDASFADGTTVVGVRFEPGVRKVLRVLLRAGTRPAFDLQLGVRSRVTARATLSTTMPDPLVREVGLPLPVAPKRWKSGYLYEDEVAVRRRPGREVFSAYLWVRGREKAPRLTRVSSERAGPGRDEVRLYELE